MNNSIIKFSLIFNQSFNLASLKQIEFTHFYLLLTNDFLIVKPINEQKTQLIR